MSLAAYASETINTSSAIAINDRAPNGLLYSKQRNVGL